MDLFENLQNIDNENINILEEDDDLTPEEEKYIFDFIEKHKGEPTISFEEFKRRNGFE